MIIVPPNVGIQADDGACTYVLDDWIVFTHTTEHFLTLPQIFDFVANLDNLWFKNLYALDKVLPVRTRDRGEGANDRWSETVCENLMYHISAEKELQEGETFPPLKTDFTGQN